MYNFQAVISKATANSLTQFDKLGYVANNMSNYNTNGYKTVRFEQMLQEDGYLTGAVRTNYDVGSTQITGNAYDVAINGQGFIPVVSPSGEVAYTRDGSFHVGKDGYLLTNDDWIVGEGIQIPANSYKVSIKTNGDVVSFDSAGSKEKKLGTIPIVQFRNSEALKSGNNNKMLATDESGDPTLVKDHNYISQYNLERSNTDVYDSVSEMLRLNASMLASMRMMKVVDDMYNKAINIRQS